jgi:PAS domain S-box-containing protein
MISTFWDIPGIRSNQSLALLEQLLDPICVYDKQGKLLYASQRFLALLSVEAQQVGFFDLFASEATPLTVLRQFWHSALQGNAIAFHTQLRDAGKNLECSLQFNATENLMFVTAKLANSGARMQQLTAAYERTIAQCNHPSLATALLCSDGKVVQCNQRLLELLGTDHWETLYLDAFVHPDDRTVDADLKQKLLNGEIPSFTIEKRLIARNYEVIWINATVSLVESADYINGHNKYFAVLLEDVTENRKVYNALIRTEEKWKAFVLNSPYLFIQTSRTGQIIYVSPAVERSLGYQEEELLDRPITELIHPNNLNEFELALHLWSNGIRSKAANIECQWRAKSGRWVSFCIQAQLFPLALEMDGIVISGYDITDRKCLELNLKTSEERFKSLVHNIPGAVFRCDSLYTMEFVSNAIQDITGYPASEFINSQERAYINLIHVDDIELIKDSITQSVLDRRRNSIEYRIIHANGQVRWVTERKQGIFDQNGSLLWLDGVLIDITDRKQAEEALHRCEAINQALVQMFPELMRLHHLDRLPDYILTQPARTSWDKAFDR